MKSQTIYPKMNDKNILSLCAMGARGRLQEGMV